MIGLSATLSHMTGVTTRIGTSLALGNNLQFTVDIATICSFFGGCLICSIIVGPNAKYNLNWRYSIGFLLEGIALTLVAVQCSFSQPAYLAKSLVALAMGLQNGLTSIWSGGMGRSTHLTGFVADSAIILGFWTVALVKSDFWKLKFMVPLFFSFMFGAFLGGHGWLALGRHVFLVPACISYAAVVFVLGFDLYRRRWARSTQEEGEDNKRTNEITTVAMTEGAQAAAIVAAAGVAGGLVVVGSDATVEISESRSAPDEPRHPGPEDTSTADDFV